MYKRVEVLGIICGPSQEHFLGEVRIAEGGMVDV